jgi:hypothetical protein
MDLSARMRQRFAGVAPWSALIAAGTAWALHHQGMSDALHFDCNATTDWVDFAWGVVALAVVVAGALASWRTLPRADLSAPAAAYRRFVVHLGLMAAALAMLAIGLQMVAGAILPGCPPP